MTRVVIRLSPFAKIAAALAMVGGFVWIYGVTQEVEWARKYGQVVLFVGAILYLIERFRMIMKSRRVPKE